MEQAQARLGHRSQIDCVTAPGTTEHTLTALETAGGTKAVVVRTGQNTAYAIESRRRLGDDAQACSTGPLTYSINSPLRSGQGPIRIVDPSPAQRRPPRAATWTSPPCSSTGRGR